ncbi:MAG: DUF2378 family protein [Pseudomonadota bacterium]
MAESEFTRPDFLSPIDVEARIAATPEHSTIKGMMFKPLLKAVEEKTQQRLGRGHYAAFTDYPLREFMQVVVEAARTLHGDLPLGEALRRLGLPVYGNLKQSAAGTFLFALAGRDLMAAVRLVNRVYNMLTTASAEAEIVNDRHAVIHLRGSYAFPEYYQTGIYEGALEIFEQQGQVRMRQSAPGAIDFQILLT